MLVIVCILDSVFYIKCYLISLLVLIFLKFGGPLTFAYSLELHKTRQQNSFEVCTYEFGLIS